jgi:hypothetical protein
MVSVNNDWNLCSLENMRLKRKAVGSPHVGSVIFNFRDRDLTTSGTTDYMPF